MKSRILYIYLIFLTGCGFSSGLYKDILSAQELIEKREFKKAARIYESILTKKPSINIRNKVNDQLGEIYSVYLNDYEKSIKHFNNIVNESNEPTWQVKSLEKIGNIYFENLNNYKKAELIYKKLVDFLPKLTRIEFYKYRFALSLFHQRKYKSANKVFSDITKEATGEEGVLAYYYLGLANFYSQKWDFAIEKWFEYLKRESRKDRIIRTKFLMANAYESSEQLKKAYNTYYSILGEYPNPEVIKSRLKSLYKRRVSRKR